MSKLFGGKGPFDDPFFTEPFDGWFGWNDPFDVQQDSRKQITIEELNPEGDGGQAQENSEPTKDLVVKNKKPSKKSNGSQSFSYRRVSYGGLNGMYYTCSEGRMAGPDGVVLVEMKEEDKTIGESLHTISKGIHNKGHSVTTKHSSDGREDTLQTLHNLGEDELGDFEQNWKANADKYFPGWDKGFSLLENQACGMSLQIGGAWVVMNIQLWSTMEIQDRSVNQGKILLGEPQEESQWSRGRLPLMMRLVVPLISYQCSLLISFDLFYYQSLVSLVGSH